MSMRSDVVIDPLPDGRRAPRIILLDSMSEAFTLDVTPELLAASPPR